MSGIDAHQHFWKFDPVRDSWITDEMSIIRKDQLPADLQPILEKHELEGSVIVQSDQSEEENNFQLSNSEKHDFIKGIVGWVDLQDKNVEEKLEYYSSFKKMKGFRHILQGEKKRDLMLSDAFMKGVGKLERFGFTYDILIFPDQLQYIPAFVSAFPDQQFVIDHIAKPDIKKGEIKEWKKAMEKVAEFENVSCKISGMVTEANWKKWKKNDFKPYLDIVVNVFGVKRLMYGSDWPVCEVAGGYDKQFAIVKDHFSSFSKDEQQAFFGNNAIQFYNLS